MKKPITNNSKDIEEIYIMSEYKSNRFNLIFLCAIIILTGAVLILNIIGVFTLPQNLLVLTIITLVVSMLVPNGVYIIHDKILKKEPSILKWDKMKYIIFAFTYVGILIISIAISYHATLLLVIPPLLLSQYRYSKRDRIIVVICSLVFIPLSVYGNCLFGMADLNLFKDLLTTEELKQFDCRLSVLLSSRSIEILFHHILPKMIIMLAILFLITIITQRNKEMVDNQVELSEKVQTEMIKKSEMQSHFIEELASVIETRDTDTGEHVQRTKMYVELIANELKKYDKYKDELTDKEIDRIISAAPLHDLGKITVSDTILLKPGKLTKEEFDIIKTHTTKGGEMIDSFFEKLDDVDFREEAYNIVMAHHEKWDGSGYPKGLKGEDIPLSARIMAISDVFDALVSKRVYKEPMNPEEAFAILIKDAGTHFDPNIIEILKTIKDEFIALSQKKI